MGCRNLEAANAYPKLQLRCVHIITRNRYRLLFSICLHKIIMQYSRRAIELSSVELLFSKPHARLCDFTGILLSLFTQLYMRLRLFLSCYLWKFLDSHTYRVRWEMCDGTALLNWGSISFFVKFLWGQKWNIRGKLRHSCYKILIDHAENGKWRFMVILLRLLDRHIFERNEIGIQIHDTYVLLYFCHKKWIICTVRKYFWKYPRGNLWSTSFCFFWHLNY